eukprot:TRINITY_DN6327_c0_g1_i2.p1 TRINITY_DN6327_c0_g1~~TRINITY_DN6327_c0_g1_i2.p1  ORF type:complete len:222 (+),score=29.91 TRINITY_DN6327_c0_g1_i2:54-719(+)
METLPLDILKQLVEYWGVVSTINLSFTCKRFYESRFFQEMIKNAFLEMWTELPWLGRKIDFSDVEQTLRLISPQTTINSLAHALAQKKYKMIRNMSYEFEGIIRIDLTRERRLRFNRFGMVMINFDSKDNGMGIRYDTKNKFIWEGPLDGCGIGKKKSNATGISYDGDFIEFRLRKGIQCSTLNRKERLHGQMDSNIRMNGLLTVVLLVNHHEISLNSQKR